MLRNYVRAWLRTIRRRSYGSNSAKVQLQETKMISFLPTFTAYTELSFKINKKYLGYKTVVYLCTVSCSWNFLCYSSKDAHVLQLEQFWSLITIIALFLKILLLTHWFEKEEPHGFSHSNLSQKT